VQLPRCCSRTRARAASSGSLSSPWYPESVRARQARAGTSRTLINRDGAADGLVAESERKGLFDGKALRGRSSRGCAANDRSGPTLINNYLLGNEAAGVRHPLLDRTRWAGGGLPTDVHQDGLDKLADPGRGGIGTRPPVD